MEANQFKAIFGGVAQAHGFTAAHGGWYQEHKAALFVLDLQKSNFGSYFELNLKLFLGHGPPINPAELKRLVRILGGDVFRRQPEEYRATFDLDASVDAADRRASLDQMFTELVDRIASAADSPAGILRLRDDGVVHLLPMAEVRLKTA